MTSPDLEFLLLGPLEARSGGRSLNLGGKHPRALLALLALNAGKVMPADRLIELLWGEEPPTSAGNGLQVHISALRKVLEPNGAPYRILLSNPSGYLLDVTPDQVDVRRFEELAQGGHLALQDRAFTVAARVLADAASVWRGSALTGLEPEPWVVAEAQRLNDLRVTAEENRLEAELALGKHSELVGELEGLVAQHPLRERLCGLLMLALYRSGRQAEGSALYYRTRDLLVDQLGMEPGPALQLLLKQILNQDASLDVEVSTVGTRRQSRPPIYHDALVGRRQEIAELANRLDTSSIMTLTGPGGIGKTRLAVELAVRRSDDYPDGVVFVDLAPLADPSMVLRTIALALGLREDDARNTIDVITSYLEGRSLLLVLDNCEHLVGGARTAASGLLSQCPDLVVLATSREALGVKGEVIWEVSALPVRDDAHSRAGLDFGEYQDAVELFRLRAEAASPTAFTWDSSVQADVVMICRKLDGIPLAVELAAARTRVLPARQLLDGLNERFALLTTASGATNPRQRSLEATVDWSYELLPPNEKAVLERLSAFAGGFSLEAAEAVCSDEAMPKAAVVPALFGLVEKSLVRRALSTDGNARYGLLETIREYSRQKLFAGAGTEGAHRRHAAYFSAMASPTEEIARSWKLVEWMAVLDQELDNFREAIEWALEAEPLVALEITTRLEEFWMRRHAVEGSAWLTRTMKAAQPSGELRACGAEAAGRLAYHVTAEKEPSRSLFNEAALLWDGLGNAARAARARLFEGHVEIELGDRDRGYALMDRAAASLRELDDGWNLVRALNNLGCGQFEMGELTEAKSCLGEALSLARRFDYPWLMAVVLGSMAEVEESMGLRDDARAHLKESLSLAAMLDDPILAIDGFQGWAQIALLEGNPELCIRLMAAVDATLRSIGAVLHVPIRAVFDATIKDARNQLPDEIGERAWSEGHEMTFDDVIALITSFSGMEREPEPAGKSL